ncbi:hypothetical protein SO802_008910 [Lithocarpus litseifolius]|uniref:Transposase n=2 Tax=Lithocarpus litseifolius TaxID=425828 RepID=A0AAW2DCI1_9ROSI
MGRKRRLELVESGQCSSHAIGSQQEETRNAALEEDIPHGATQDDDATEPPDDMVATPANVISRPKRGSTLMRDIWNLPPGTKHVLHLNGEGQPIGPSGATFKRWMGTITRKYYMCPVVPIDWREVPIQYKRECWGEIERRWAIPADKVPLVEQEDWAMQLLGHLRRARRTLLKKEHCLESMSKQEVMDNIPNNCDEEQWKKLVEYWFTEGVQTKALQNKASRGFQKEIPRTGPRSLAQLVAILENETGRPVERAVVYDKAYRHKDGTPVTDKAAENMRRMQELLNAGTQLIGESSHGGGILWAPDDAYAQVMGKERHGRVRGVGFGPTPSGRKAKDVLPDSTTPRQSYASDQRVVELEDQIATLTRARAEDANKIEALVQLVTLERTQRIERDAQFKKMMDSVSQHVRELQTQSEEDAHADVDDGDELDDGDALDDGDDRFF